MQICTSPIQPIKGNRADGTTQGAFAHELAAIEYAGWISPNVVADIARTLKQANIEGYRVVSWEQGLHHPDQRLGPPFL